MINNVTIQDTTDGTTYSCQSDSPDRLINYLAWYIESSSNSRFTVARTDPALTQQPTP